MARGPGLAVSDFPHTLGGVGTGLVHGDPPAVIALGLLILLATPVVRVAVSIVAFAWKATGVVSSPRPSCS